MNIRRIVPNVPSSHRDESRAFYAGFLGLEVAMDVDILTTFVSPSNATAQVQVIAAGAAELQREPSMTVEVPDVDAAYDDAVRRGVAVVVPIRTAPDYPIRSFIVRDPNNLLVHVMSHLTPPA
jgi:catechol 2,3-dioxygenase-like lactoylglutathione lyase family enzyme